MEERETPLRIGRMESEIQERGVKHRKLRGLGPEQQRVKSDAAKNVTIAEGHRRMKNGLKSL